MSNEFKMDTRKGMANLICGKFTVGRNYNSTYVNKKGVIANCELDTKQKLLSMFGTIDIKTAFKIRNALYKINMMYK